MAVGMVPPPSLPLHRCRLAGRMGGLNKTIHFDFLIKALNKKIRADCLIEENARNAPKPAPPETPQTSRHSDCRGHAPGHTPRHIPGHAPVHTAGPRTLVIQGLGAPAYMRSPTRSRRPKAASQRYRQMRLLHAAHELLNRLVHQEQQHTGRDGDNAHPGEVGEPQSPCCRTEPTNRRARYPLPRR